MRKRQDSNLHTAYQAAHLFSKQSPYHSGTLPIAKQNRQARTGFEPVEISRDQCSPGTTRTRLPERQAALNLSAIEIGETLAADSSNWFSWPKPLLVPYTWYRTWESLNALAHLRCNLPTLSLRSTCWLPPARRNAAIVLPTPVW